MITSISILVLQPLALYRFLFSRDASYYFDCAWIILLYIYRNTGPRHHLEQGLNCLLSLSRWHYFTLLGGVVCSLLIRYSIGSSKSSPNSDTKIRKLILPPLLIPSRTTHTRFFPKKHSFSYSYLYVGIPVGWKGRSGSLLSADTEVLPKSERRYGWFHVSADDFLEGPSSPGGLEGKLTDFLRNQGLERPAWTFAYLVTAPRFLGYSFNPVSFWYIYDAKQQLIMMVLEVNNTFDERRMYILKRDDPNSSTFTDTWAKDFHVSPFNSRKGTYSLKAVDPLASQTAGSLQIDNSITLKSSQEHVKLVARVASTTEAVSPEGMSTWSSNLFVLRHGWIGFLTSPRIVYEAGRLFFKRSLHVWFRPEIANTSIGRAATAEEHAIEKAFRAYIRDLIRHCPRAIKLTYCPPSRMSTHEVMQSMSADVSKTPSLSLSIKILTPAFYSRFVHYAHTLEAFDREGLQTDSLNRTIEIDDMALMTRIIHDQPRQAIKSSRNCNDSIIPGSAKLERCRWRILQAARCPVAAQAYPDNHILRPPGSSAPKRSETKPRASEYVVSDIRKFGLSSLDKYVKDNESSADGYRRAVTRLLIAERVAYGQIWVIKGLDLVIRASMIWAAFGLLERIEVDGSRAADIRIVVTQLFWAVVGAAVAGLPHAWSLAKG